MISPVSPVSPVPPEPCLSPADRQPSNPRARYSDAAIAFHWLLALMIIGSFSFGVYMSDLPFSPSRIKQFNWHKWAGITILALSALRLLWRLTHRPPPLDLVKTWQTLAADATHWLMYGLFFAIPLAGWAYSSAAGFPVVYFGVLSLPDWVDKNADLADQLKLLHKILAFSLAAVVALHVAAAAKHQWFDKDRLMDRMNPFVR
ncbi:MAG: cytochrome b [Polaromonas sp.]